VIFKQRSNDEQYGAILVEFRGVRKNFGSLEGAVWESGSDAMLRNPATPELKQFVGSGF